MDSTLKLRFITGFVLITAVLLWVFFTPPPLFALFALVVLISIGGWEWGKLVDYKETQRGFFVAALIVVSLIAYLFTELRQSIIIAGVVWWAVILFLLSTYKREAKQYKDNKLILKISAFLVLIPAWVALLSIHQQNPLLVVYLIFLIAMTDSGALFIGKAFGKNKLAPELSPGKTREGALGGLVFAGIWALAGAAYFDIASSDWLYFILISMAVALLSIPGDLFESLLKRESGQKDSGTILPGHGGILDRVDGIVAALPLFAFGISGLTISV